MANTWIISIFYKLQEIERSRYANEGRITKTAAEPECLGQARDVPRPSQHDETSNGLTWLGVPYEGCTAYVYSTECDTTILTVPLHVFYSFFTASL